MAMVQRKLQHFNSQPHKEADSVNVCTVTGRRHFNSQPHKEADGSRRGKATNQIISTHSLTRRLTTYDDDHIKRGSISTHSLTRRLTCLVLSGQNVCSFQLTASQGG